MKRAEAGSGFMNVQGRRGRLSCDNKGERLIHKKKKKMWLVAGTDAENRWPLCGDCSDPRATTSGAGPSGLASAAPATGTASGGGGEKNKPQL